MNISALHNVAIVERVYGQHCRRQDAYRVTRAYQPAAWHTEVVSAGKISLTAYQRGRQRPPDGSEPAALPSSGYVNTRAAALGE